MKLRCVVLLIASIGFLSACGDSTESILEEMASFDCPPPRYVVLREQILADPETNTPLLTQILRSGDKRLQMTAAALLVKMPRPALENVLATLAEILRDGVLTSKQREHAAYVLASQGSGGMTHVVRALSGDDRTGRLAAAAGLARALEEVGGLNAEYRLLTQPGYATDPTTPPGERIQFMPHGRADVESHREQVLKRGLIAMEAYELAVPPLVAMLDRGDKELREAATDALWSMPRIKVSDAREFANALREPPGFSSSRTADVALLADPDLLVPLLEAWYADYDGLSGVVKTVVRARLDKALPLLVQHLKSVEKETRLGALSALQDLGTDAAPAIPTLREMQNDPDSEIRWYTGAALAQIEKPPPGDSD